MQRFVQRVEFQVGRSLGTAVLHAVLCRALSILRARYTYGRACKFLSDNIEASPPSHRTHRV